MRPVAILLVAGVALVAAAGCTSVPRAPERPLRALLEPQKRAWNAPVRLTARAGGVLEGDYHPGTRRLVYSSREAGDPDLWLLEKVPGGLSLPRRVAQHTARDRRPALGPGGRRVLFTSGRRDAMGDIYFAKLAPELIDTLLFLASAGGRLPLLPNRPEVRRLTGAENAEEGACWHPSGNRIFYAASSGPDEPYNLYALKPGGGSPQKLTRGGGQMPACSPDGRFLAFSARRDGRPHIYVLRLGAEGGKPDVAALTHGPGIDVFPAWSRDGRRIYFVRYPRDHNRDGRVDEGDVPSIFSVAFTSEVFGGTTDPAPVRQLTSGRFRDTAPRAVPGGFLFVNERGEDRGGAAGDAGLWALPFSGLGPDARSVGGFLDFARREERSGENGAWRRLLAWQNAWWAIREARRGGEVRMDLPHESDAAEAPVRMAMVLAELGHREEAAGLLGVVAQRFGESGPWTAMARVRKLELEHRSLRRERDPDWEAHLGRANALRKRFEQAAGPAGAGSDRMLTATALAILEVGRTRAEMGSPEGALRNFDEILQGYPEQKEACARALMATAQVFRSFQQPDAERGAYVRLLRRWGDAEPWASRAAAQVVERTIEEAGESQQEQVRKLRRLIEVHDQVPLLPALAQNRIGELQHEAQDYRAAATAYRRSIENYPDSPRQVGAAYVALGELQLRREQYPGALLTFGQLREHIDRTGAWEFERHARRGYVRAALRKGRAELNQGDPALARSTFHDLIEFDPHLAAAHRGLVDCLVRMDRVEDAIRRYRPVVEEEPRNAVAHFALARAYSYYGPEDWRAGSSASRRRVAIDREALKLVGRAIMLDFEVAYYHQLRGFLFNRIALITGSQDAGIQALDSYLSALGLSDPELDPLNHANLLFNVGEGYMLVDQPENAYDYYRRAVEAGFGFEGPRGEAALQKVSRAAMDAGDYEFAVRLLHRVRERVGGPLPEETARRVEVLVRRGRIYDLLALTHYLAEDYEQAAENYGRSIRTVRRLIELHPPGRPVYMRNLLRAQRNQAINLYHAVQEAGLPLGRLRRSWQLLRESLEGLQEHGTIEPGEAAGPGIFTIDIRVAIGEGGEAGDFDLPTEKRLLYTYLARISALAGNYREAERFLLRKLDHYPKFDPEDRPDLAGEQGILWSQIGEYRLRRNELAGVAEAFEKALQQERAAGNLVGEMSACFSLGRLLVRLSRRAEGEKGMSEEEFESTLRRVVSYHRELTAAADQPDAAVPAAQMARLERNLAVLGPMTEEEVEE